MTVAELIEELRKLPPEAEAFIENGNGDFGIPVTGLSVFVDCNGVTRVLL